MENNSILQSYNGLIRFYDGTLIAIEDQEYSSDGLYNWEKIFNPYDHISTLDGVSHLAGHRYKRVKHSGDSNFQLPYRIIPEEPIFRIQDNILQYKLETQSDTEWVTLLNLESLKGEDGDKGEQGIPGEGFNIDLYGYYKARPSCADAIQTVCNTCNTSGSTSNSAVTFLSLGDGVLELTQPLITAGTVTVDGVAYTHFSNDLVSWNALTAGIVDFKARYLATDGTGSVYTDMRTEDYYGTRGVAYVCVNGSWTVLTNIATPSYMVGERTGSTNIGFIDNFIDDTLVNFVSNTIGLTTDGKLEVAQETLNNTSFTSDVFGYGLNYTAGNAVELDPSDFIGFGLGTYVADSDSEEKIQVLVDSLIGDGTRVESAITIDNETRNYLGVDVNDLINNNSGIIATAQVDTFYDLMINLGAGLELDGDTPQAIQVKVDDLSLEVNATDLHIKAYVGGNDGIMLQHLNPNIIWVNKGFGLDLANGLYTRIDGATVGYDGSGNLEIPLNGITGDRLNDNTADNTKGLEVSNDKLTVKVDASTIDFNGSGELTYIGAAGMYVSSLTAGGTTVRDDVIFNVTTANGSVDIDLSATINAGSDTIDLILDIDEAWLAAYLIAHPPAGSAATWGSITGTITAQSDLVSYISGLSHVVRDTWYDDTQINSTHGLVLRAPTGETYKLVVDAEGNTDTVNVTL